MYILQLSVGFKLDPRSGTGEVGPVDHLKHVPPQVSVCLSVCLCLSRKFGTVNNLKKRPTISGIYLSRLYLSTLHHGRLLELLTTTHLAIYLHFTMVVSLSC